MSVPIVNGREDKKKEFIYGNVRKRLRNEGEEVYQIT